jgi:uncharacterized repeat protein (TIGR03803 family)
MAKLSAWKMGFAVFVLCAATATGAQAQTFTTLGSFDGTDGSFPESISLVQGYDGNLYGTTSSGGANQNGSNFGGVIFRVTPAGAISPLYSFCAEQNCLMDRTPGQDWYWLLMVAFTVRQCTAGSLMTARSSESARGGS